MKLDQLAQNDTELANAYPRAFMLEQELFLQLDGIKVPLGRMRTHLESVRVADLESLRRELASGWIPPLALRLVPGNGDKGQKVLVPRTCSASPAFRLHGLPR